jgi:hypothetical protein
MNGRVGFFIIMSPRWGYYYVAPLGLGNHESYRFYYYTAPLGLGNHGFYLFYYYTAPLGLGNHESYRFSIFYKH